MTTERDPEMAEPTGTGDGAGIGSADLAAPSTAPSPASPMPSTAAVSPADARRSLAMDGSIAESAGFPRPSTGGPGAAMTAAGAMTATGAMAAGAGTMSGQTTIADPLLPPTPVAPPAATTDPATIDVTVKKPSRRLTAARGGIRLIQFVFGVALFVAGVWIGTLIFQANQKPSDVAAAGGVSNGIPAPPVVQEFADALGRGGPDAVRSSLSTDVFALLTSELNRWSYATITNVDVLATAQDGPRTATGLILTGRTTDGRTMWINLIVHTDDGKISTLR